MQRFLVLALFGLAAQFIDGALGMAYGLTSTTLLLSVGIAPAVASASVHLSEVGTTLISGVAHWKLGNTDWRVVGWLALPGGIGAFLGAVALTSIPADTASRWIAAFLFCMGIYILVRFIVGWRPTSGTTQRVRGRFLVPLGFGAGLLDAAGGGGWGPISTPTLLAAGRMQPRKVVGTVDTSEFVVAVCASIGFLIALERSDVALQVVAALLLGGVVAAPVAAWLVRAMHPRALGIAVGGLIVVTNGRTLLSESGLTPDLPHVAYLLVLVLSAGVLLGAVQAARSRRAVGEPPAQGD